MASLEQLRMLDDEETSTSTSEDEDEEESSPAAAAAASANAYTMPGKVGSNSNSCEQSVTNGIAIGQTHPVENTHKMDATSAASDADVEETFNPLKRVQPSPSAPYKKRIKLSLGGSLRAANPSTPGVAEKIKNGVMKLSSRKAATATATTTAAVEQSTKTVRPLPGLPIRAVAGGSSEPRTPAASSNTPTTSTTTPVSAVLESREKPKRPPKRSLPLKKKAKLVEVEFGTESIPAAISASVIATPAPPHSQSIEVRGESVEAVVVGNDDSNGEVDAVAEVIAQPVKRKQARLPMSSKSKVSTPPSSALQASPAKKRAVNAVRTVRLPPMSSPGLLIPPGMYRGHVNSNGLVPPRVIFAQAMETAGYTAESRTKFPHRGSSVQRVVGDMFDSDVKCCSHFPKLVPNELLGSGPELPAPESEPKETESKGIECDAISYTIEGEQCEKTDSSEIKSKPAVESGNTKTQPAPKLRMTLPERLIQAFQSSGTMKTNNGSIENASLPKGGRKLRRIRGFSDMAPLSLTLPYPEHYTRKRLAYMEKVNEREKAIIEWQADEEALEDAKDRDEALGKSYSGPITSQVVIPPIPEPPDPPRLNEIHGMDTDLYEQDQHPLYPPKNNFVNHLDKDAFHITEGRYFGLTCNAIADPHFVGANCPGIGGLNMSASTGLATASSGGGGLGGTLLVLPAPAVLSVDSKTPQSTSSKKPSASSTKQPPKLSKSLKVTGSTTPVSANKAKAPPKKGASKLGSKGNVETKVTSNTLSPAPPKKKGNGPPVTASASELRKVMEDGGEDAEKVKGIIIRGAVHAARAGKHDGRSFRTSNIKVYPDVSKAFALYAGMKPCIRCKSNKQGSYHCRLRRKHKEADYDGGDSWIQLAPYFEMPMAELVVKPNMPKS